MVVFLSNLCCSVSVLYNLIDKTTMDLFEKLPVELVHDFFDRVKPVDMLEFFAFNSSEKLRPIWTKYLRKSNVLCWKQSELPEPSVMHEVTTDISYDNNIRSLYFFGTEGVPIKNNKIEICRRTMNIVEFSDYVFNRVVITLSATVMRELNIKNCSGGIFVLGGGMVFLTVELSCLSAFNMEPDSNSFRIVTLINADIADTSFLEYGDFLRQVQFTDCNFNRLDVNLCEVAKTNRLGVFCLRYDDLALLHTNRRIIFDVYRAINAGYLNTCVFLEIPYIWKKNSTTQYENGVAFGNLNNLVVLKLQFMANENFTLPKLIDELVSLNDTQIAIELLDYKNWSNDAKSVWNIFYDEIDGRLEHCEVTFG